MASNTRYQRHGIKCIGILMLYGLILIFATIGDIQDGDWRPSKMTKKAYYKDHWRIDVMEGLIYTFVICLCGFR